MGSIQHCATGRSVELDADTLVGSSSRCNLTLRHDSVSRNHASICWLPGGWYVEDRNSKNGTWVDGEPLGSATRLLRQGTILRFGARGVEEWCVTCLSPPPHAATSSTTTLPQILNQATISILTDASLVLSVGTAVHELEWRAPFMTLKVLGMERLKDRRDGLSEDREGWLDRRLLAELCARDINQDIFRIRNAFEKLELFVDAQNIVEDLREVGKVRLGMYHVRVD